MHHRNPTAKAGLALLLLALSTAPGCKDKAKCDEALNTAKKAMQDEFLDMDLARQWRDHAGKICGQGPELEALDKEIIDREAALAKAVADAAQQAADDGKAALEKATKLWKKFDKLDEEKQDKKALNQAKKKANQLVVGLTPEYGKQVDEFNEKQYKSRAKKLQKDEKK
jgi:hypothetical protein